MIRLKIGKKSRKVVYNWESIKELQVRLGMDFDAKISEACLTFDMDVLAEALSIGTGLEKIEIIAESPAITDSISCISRALNLSYHGTEEPKESLKESLARKFKTLYYSLKRQRTATA